MYSTAWKTFELCKTAYKTRHVFWTIFWALPHPPGSSSTMDQIIILNIVYMSYELLQIIIYISIILSYITFHLIIFNNSNHITFCEITHKVLTVSHTAFARNWLSCHTVWIWARAIFLRHDFSTVPHHYLGSASAGTPDQLHIMLHHPDERKSSTRL